jgi:hypothetical protein
VMIWWGRNLSASAFDGSDAPSQGIWRHRHDLQAAHAPISVPACAVWDRPRAAI